MYKRRVFLAQWVFIVLGLLLVYRLLEIQLFYPHSDKIARIKQQQVNQGRENKERINLVDRNGEYLAVSIEQYALYVAPVTFVHNSEQKQALLFDYLDSIGKLRNNVKQKLNDSSAPPSIALATRLTPIENDYIRSLRLSGVWADKQYKRYYPAGEAVAQVVGFVDNDNQGIEGVELLYDEELTTGHNTPQGIRDGKGNLIKLVSHDASVYKQPLSLSLDLQLQYLAYQHLVVGCRQSGATAGIIVTLNSQNGEVLAVAQYPSFNPNNRKNLDLNAVRNRALTDVFEPGSTFKPLILASILENKDYSLADKVDTNPGYFKLSGITVRDSRNYGELSISDVIARSSNVGISRLSQAVDSRQIIDTLYRMGIGRRTGSQFPGEREGYLPFKPLDATTKAVMSYGYGISLTPLQLAKAYGVLANGGQDFFVTFRKDERLDKRQVLDMQVANQVLETMKKVVSPAGTGRNAQVPGYTLAGKTGTVHKNNAGVYYRDKYVAFFVGILPVKNSRFVTLVMLDEPKSNSYYGGEAAAPIFSSYTKDLFALYGILPDSDI